jgi:hypothetical protein
MPTLGYTDSMPETIQSEFPRFQVDGYCWGCEQYWIPKISKTDGKRHIFHGKPDSRMSRSGISECKNEGRCFGPVPDDVVTPWEQHGKLVEVAG